jgi:predicted RNase H-like HicB family nuclease
VRREFTVIIEKDEDGYFVGSVPQLKGCHTQAKSLDELMERIREATLVCIETEAGVNANDLQFIGIQKIAV